MNDTKDWLALASSPLLKPAFDLLLAVDEAQDRRFNEEMERIARMTKRLEEV